LVISGVRIVGLVSLSDLKRQHVRAALAFLIVSIIYIMPSIVAFRRDHWNRAGFYLPQSVRIMRCGWTIVVTDQYTCTFLACVLKRN